MSTGGSSEGLSLESGEEMEMEAPSSPEVSLLSVEFGGAIDDSGTFVTISGTEAEPDVDPPSDNDEWPL